MKNEDKFVWISICLDANKGGKEKGGISEDFMAFRPQKLNEKKCGYGIEMHHWMLF